MIDVTDFKVSHRRWLWSMLANYLIRRLMFGRKSSSSQFYCCSCMGWPTGGASAFEFDPSKIINVSGTLQAVLIHSPVFTLPFMSLQVQFFFFFLCLCQTFFQTRPTHSHTPTPAQTLHHCTTFAFKSHWSGSCCVVKSSKKKKMPRDKAMSLCWTFSAGTVCCEAAAAVIQSIFRNSNMALLLIEGTMKPLIFRQNIPVPKYSVLNQRVNGYRLFLIRMNRWILYYFILLL